jgi:xylan 1,4-beta-xylosidase
LTEFVLKFFFSSALALMSLALTSPVLSQVQPPTASTEQIEVDLSVPAKPFPHFWEQMFGSGRAILSLRDSYRQDLRTVKAATDFRYIRFHNILSDEVGVYDEDAQGNPIYNFSYVDQIYDGLLQNGIRPFVEVSFMPKKLAVSQQPHAFWYKPLPNPPKNWKKWEELNYQFAKHLVDRYGIDEVSQWYFEIWNEPNIDFWTGVPKDTTYYQLYDSAVRGIKRVSPRLRVGGPATAQAAWAERFIAHCVQTDTPLDFFSTHVYGNDTAKNVFGTQESIPRRDMVCRAVANVHRQIQASGKPQLPLIWSEFNADYGNKTEITDSPFMAAWLANTIRECDGLLDIMSYWSFSDVFEEQGVVKTPFYGGFGLIAERGIPKPAFNAFKLLHRLGEQRIQNQSEDVIVTRRKDGATVIAVWNYAPPEQSGPAKQVTLHLNHLTQHHAQVSIVDANHGSPLPAFAAQGKPDSPNMAQIEQLRKAAELRAPQTINLAQDTITLELPGWALAVVEIK